MGANPKSKEIKKDDAKDEGHDRDHRDDNERERFHTREVNGAVNERKVLFAAAAPAKFSA